MTWRMGPAIVAACVTTFTFANVARADDTVRVIIAGPKKDPIAARLEKELVALGYAPIAVGAMPDCTAPAVGDAVKNAGASAALCSNGERIAVWTDDGTDVKLRDSVQVKGNGASASGASSIDTVAMQAAEVMRANIAFREPEPVAPEASPSPAMSDEKWGNDTGNWDDLLNEDRAMRRKKQSPPRAARFGAGVGASTLTGAGALVSGLSFGVSYGAHRSFSLNAQLELPLASTTARSLTSEVPRDHSPVRITPGLVGAGVEFPFLPPDAKVIPRLGIAGGAAWLHATKAPGSVADQFGNAASTTQETSATKAALAGWITGSLSFAIVGPMRASLNGLIGSTAGQIAVLNQGVPVAKWGTPIASFGARLELLLP